MLQVPLTYTAPLSELAGVVMWIYVLGNRAGTTIKFGHTKGRRVRERLQRGLTGYRDAEISRPASPMTRGAKA